MNVLKKILEEIRQYKEDKYPIANKTTGDIEEIIRSHMDEVTNADAKEKPILCTVGKNEALTPYDDTYDIIIHCLSKEDQDKAAELIKSLNWIPVSDGLPEGTEDDDCPEFNVTIKGADKATTLKYAPDGPWFDDYGEVYKVIAWKPLPEAYKEGK